MGQFEMSLTRVTVLHTPDVIVPGRDTFSISNSIEVSTRPKSRFSSPYFILPWVRSTVSQTSLVRREGEKIVVEKG